MMWFEVVIVTFSLSFFSVKSQCEFTSLVLALLLPLKWFFVVSVTWNGTTITGPVLIYSDELPVNPSANTTGDPNRPGALICRSEDETRVSWHFINGFFVRGPEFTDTFKQIRTGEGVTPSLAQLLLNRENTERTNPSLNGVWHCRLNSSPLRDGENSEFQEQINVGIFYRGGGMCSQSARELL